MGKKPLISRRIILRLPFCTNLSKRQDHEIVGGEAKKLSFSLASEHGTCAGDICIMSGNIQPRVMIESHGQNKNIGMPFFVCWDVDWR